MSTPPEPRRLDEWVLARYARQPARGRLVTASITAGLVALVGVVDWITGSEVSVSVFYLIPVAIAVVRMGPGTGTGVALASVAVRLFGDFLVAGEAAPPSWVWWNAAASLVFFLVVIWILHAHIRLHRRLEQRVADRTRALHTAVADRERIERELREVGARERATVGRELHDDLGQHLVGTAFAAKVLAEQLGPIDSRAAHDAATIVHLLGEGIAKTRTFARGLLLANIAPAEFNNELAELAARGSRTGVTCQFRTEGNPVIDDPTTTVQLFRIAQEGMRNALQHGHPTRVDLTLTRNEQGLVLTIEDDGGGLPAPEARGAGVGLRIMAHRATVIGGTLSFENTPAPGTRVSCHVPRRGTETVPAS